MSRSEGVNTTNKRGRLTRSGDFDRVYRRGRSHAGRYAVVYEFEREASAELAEARLGVSVNRRLGRAVERNRVKRLLREAFWSVSPEVKGGRDYVIVARSGIVELAKGEGLKGVQNALRDALSANLEEG